MRGGPRRPRPVGLRPWGSWVYGCSVWAIPSLTSFAVAGVPGLPPRSQVRYHRHDATTDGPPAISRPPDHGGSLDTLPRCTHRKAGRRNDRAGFGRSRGSHSDDDGSGAAPPSRGSVPLTVDRAAKAAEQASRRSLRAVEPGSGRSIGEPNVFSVEQVWNDKRNERTVVAEETVEERRARFERDALPFLDQLYARRAADDPQPGRRRGPRPGDVRQGVRRVPPVHARAPTSRPGCTGSSPTPSSTATARSSASR